MFTIYKQSDFGSYENDWLQSQHHFSFGEYYNQDRMGFGHLRVVNEDIIAPKSGFAMHPHQNMEIITYVVSGAITHEDSLGNRGVTKAGQIQVMSAGSGIRHSEMNETDTPTHLFQIWIKPNQLDVEPSWQDQVFPKSNQSGLRLLAASQSNDSDTLKLHQTANLYAGQFEANERTEHPISGKAYMIIAQGEIRMNDQILQAGDAVEIENEDQISWRTQKAAKILLMDQL